MNLSPLETLLLTALVCLVFFIVFGILGLSKKRGDVADVAWGLGFIVVSWTSWILSSPTLFGAAVNSLVTVWGVRLASHIYLRNRNRAEDFRYLSLRSQWKKFFRLRFFVQIFLFQALILYAVAFPILWIHLHPESQSWEFFTAAALLWLIGFFYEAVGDYQLFHFRKKDRQALCTEGLWKTTRHPNYFGEILQWWAVWAIAIPAPYGLFLIFSPLLITFLILKISGVAPLEAKMRTNPAFADYAKNTPTLFPTGFLNGFFYTAGWFAIVYFGSNGEVLSALWSALAVFILQLSLFAKSDRKSLILCLPLAVYGFALGLFQESLFVFFRVLAYPDAPHWVPYWIVALYVLFSLNLNASLSFLNRNLFISFLLGGIGAALSYVSGKEMGAVLFLSPYSIAILIFCWGVYLTLLTLLNRRLLALWDLFLRPEALENNIRVFYDGSCPICSREIALLKQRKQTGSIQFIELTPRLAEIPRLFSHEEAMERIHAVDGMDRVATGIEALSLMYARTDLPLLSLLLQAPAFKAIFRIGYLIWSKTRRSSRLI